MLFPGQDAEDGGRRGAAGVVHEDVNGTEGVLDPRHVRVDHREVAEVPLESDRAASGFPYPRRRGLRGLLADVGDRDRDPLRAEDVRDRAAESTSGAVHQRDPIGDAEIHRFSSPYSNGRGAVPAGRPSSAVGPVVIQTR